MGPGKTVSSGKIFRDRGILLGSSGRGKGMPASPQEISRLLMAWSQGDEDALDRLTPLVYDELRRIARRYLHGPSQSLQTTALVHEAFLRLVGQPDKQWQNREHFFGVAARAMRHILVDHARARCAEKRGGGLRVSWPDAEPAPQKRAADLVALDDALSALSRLAARAARVVELRFFGGLNIEETARVLKISPETVGRDWRFAKSWLLRELSAAGPARSRDHPPAGKVLSARGSPE
jgi:RNA polymerase sigma factor (TIGR02999 family)